MRKKRAWVYSREQYKRRRRSRRDPIHIFYGKEAMKSDKSISVVILAAGKGTRMKSAKAKVLHEVFFKPMLHHVIAAVEPLTPDQTVVIVGHQEHAVRRSLKDFDVEIVRQEKQLGTGHAVQMTEKVITDDEVVVMIVCGDTPLIRPAALAEMYRLHIAAGGDLSVMTTILDNPFGYGRIIADKDGVQAIVEEKEADEHQKKIREINAGIYLANRKFLFEALATVTADNTQGEFYLTDIVEYCVSSGGKVAKYLNPDPREVLGVNSRVELEAADAELQRRRNVEIMQQGVSLCTASTVRISPQTEIGGDSRLYQGCQILGNTRIGRSCILEAGVILENCTIGDDVRIGPYSILRDSEVADGNNIPALTKREGENFL